jgi:hypothetical protein
VTNDPRAVGGHARVHARVRGEATADAERDDADLIRTPVVHDENGPAAIALARVDAAHAIVARTEHVAQDAANAVLALALGVGDDGHRHLARGRRPARHAGLRAVPVAHRRRAPACDGRRGTGGRVARSVVVEVSEGAARAQLVAAPAEREKGAIHAPPAERTPRGPTDDLDAATRTWRHARAAAGRRLRTWCCRCMTGGRWCVRRRSSRCSDPSTSQPGRARG